jgi:uncharacterized protein
VSHWFSDAAVAERGPLVFSLPLDGEWKELKKYGEKSADWQITPSRAWNFALELGECTMTAHEGAVPEVAFDVHQPAVTLRVHAKAVPEWKEIENSAGPLPVSPVSSDQPATTLNLVPYGAAKLRITAFPYLDERPNCSVGSSAAAGR